MANTEIPGSIKPRKPSLKPPIPSFLADLSSLRGPLLNNFAFLGQRLAFGIFVLLFIIFLSYLGIDMATGTDFQTAFRQAIPDSIAYIDRLLDGEMGLTSAGSDTLLALPVTQVIQERLLRSIGLLTVSLLFASFVGITLGILAARNRSERSLAVLIASIIGISMPSFFAAFLLQWFVISLTRQAGRTTLPVGGFGWDAHLILPMLVLAMRPIAQITRMTFVSIREILSQDYIRTAYSKGLHRYDIMTTHVMRNAAIPILTTVGISLRFALSSLPVVELYFGWPGAGLTMLKGIARQDVNLVIGLALCFAIFFILVNTFLDFIFRLIDPRLLKKPEHIASTERQNFFETIQNIWATLRSALSNNPVVNLFKRSSSQSTEVPSYSIATLNQAKLQVEVAEDSRRNMKSAWLALLRNFPLVVGGLMVAGLLLIVVIGPLLAPNSPFRTQGIVMTDGKLTTPPFPPDETYPWGTDALGRGLMSLILSGAQQTLTLAILAVAARMLVGIVLGAFAGWKNGSTLDRFIVGLAEVISAFPALIATMILILAVGIRQGMSAFVFALCFVGWGEVMLFVRSEVITIQTKPFIESAIAVGSNTLRIVSRHILPNLFAALISIAALEIGAVLILLGELGFISIFIGGGSQIVLPSMSVHYSDVPEWGALLSNIRLLVRSYPWTGLYPMLAFFFAILSFNLFGEGVRRLIEEGNPLLNRIFNRYTMLVAIGIFLGYNWISANSGAAPFYRQHALEFNGERSLRHVEIFTQPFMDGRALASPGMDLAASYTANQFEESGLQPGGEDHSYYQERLRSFERLDSVPVLKIPDGGSDLVYGVDHAAFPGLNFTEGEANAPIRYIGLGEQASVQSLGWYSSYPDLDRADYSGEILLTLTEWEAHYLTQVPKDGLLVVSDDPDKLARRYTLSGRSGKRLNIFTGERSGEETPYLWISEEVADRLLASSGITVEQLRDQARELTHTQVFDMQLESKASISIEGTLIEDWPVKNVIGLIPGTHGWDNCADCLGKKLIVVLAQYDNPPIGPRGFFPAANDNASGVAVMLEAIRILQETEYQPYKSFLFIAYSGEGLDGGKLVSEPDVKMFLQANPAFSNFDLEAIVKLRGVGGGEGERLEVSAGGSLRLAELFEKAARQMGVRVVRADESIDIGLIYDQSNPFLESGQEAPVLRLYWEGWEEHSRLPTDTLENISVANLEDAGRTLALSLMILGRETNY